MKVRLSSRLCLILVAASFISACNKGYVYNDERYGPILVKKQGPVPGPVRKPRPIVAPKLVELSVKQQNEKAISVFTSKGFEAVENDRGVVVYLPPTIYFKGSQSSITLAARSKISEVAQELALPYLSKRSVEIAGHTDTLGSEPTNMALSKERSLAATAELVFSGVSKTRLSSVWFGETRLRAPDYHKDGSLNVNNRNLNRRVEFTILNPVK